MAESIADIGNRGPGRMSIACSGGSSAGQLAAEAAAMVEGLDDPAGIAEQIDDEREVLWNRLN